MKLILYFIDMETNKTFTRIAHLSFAGNGMQLLYPLFYIVNHTLSMDDHKQPGSQQFGPKIKSI